jgi:crossover junction endodeoxyribonuclease RuvC
LKCATPNPAGSEFLFGSEQIEYSARHCLCLNFAVGITLRQFEQLQNRSRKTTAAVEPALRAIAAHSVILGIDPSLRGTGYGVLRMEGRQPKALGHGTVRCAGGWSRSRCLAEISRTIRLQIEALRPTACVLEGLFYAQNIQTALIMGEARGASLVAAAEAGLEIFEIAPRKVKQAIVGYGAAQKLAVAKMVQRMLNLSEPPAADAADALALALAYAQTLSRYSFDSVKRI